MLKTNNILDKILNKTFAEIDEAILNFNRLKENIDELIDKDIKEIISEKIIEHKKNFSAEEYIMKNPDIINTLKEKLKIKYFNLIDEKIKILEKSKEQFLLIPSDITMQG